MSDSRPLFSVIIPTYNRAAKVVRAVESALAQTLPDFDVWVVDDGSTDGTTQALAPYLDRVHYLPQDNRGVAEARNRGIRESSGAYLALLDSDDRWVPHKLQSLAAAIQTRPDVGLFYSQWDVLNEEGQRLWVDRSRAVSGNAYRALLQGDFLAASSAVISRQSIEKAGDFDPAMQPCEDWDLWLRIARQFPIFRVPEVLVEFEYTSHDKVTANTRPWLEAHDRVIEKAFARDPGLDPAFRQAVRANIAFIKGRVCLQANARPEALGWFNRAAALRPALLKAQLYRLLLSNPALLRLLPRPVRTRLRLPQEKGTTR